MCCRPGRKNSGAGIWFLSIENVVAFDRRALFCQNFKHLLIQLTCEHQLDFVLNSVFMIHHKIVLLQSGSQASFHSCQCGWQSVTNCIWVVTKTLNCKNIVTPEIISFFTAGIMNHRWAAYSSYCRYIVSLICNGVTHRKSSNMYPA